MASAKVDRLSRAINQLESYINSTDPHIRKSSGFEKERSLCSDIRDIIVCNDFNSVYKEDNRYADHVNRAVQVIFRLMNHSDQSMRSYAEESLDAVIRSLILGFHQYRVLVCLISEISRNGSSRSLVAAYARLSHLIHLSKPNRMISYGLHIVNALKVMLKRPEEAIQQAIVQHTSTIFAAVGPRLRDQHTEKIFQLYQIAAENLDIVGTSNRAGVTVISQICIYFNSILQKAFVRCLMNIRAPEELEHRSRIVGSLNTLKFIWTLVVRNQTLFTPENLRMCLCSIICCLHSQQSEILVASMELVEAMFSEPLEFMRTFDPTALRDVLVFDNRLGGSDRTSLASLKQESEDVSLRSSPMGSVLDVSNLDTSLQPFDSPLCFPAEYDGNDVDSDDTETQNDEEIIDPLMHSDLYEEFNREPTPPSTESTSSQSSPERSATIPSYPPVGFCVDGANYCVYTAATLGKLFLLSGLKGLKNDREIRISHKILALNCLTSIAKTYDLADVDVFIDSCQQPLLDAVRFVLHEDDSLCAAAVNFGFAVDKYNPINKGNVTHYLKVASSFQPIRKRAILLAACGEQDLLLSLGIFPELVSLAVTEVNSSFFLIKIACAEFLCSIRWEGLSGEMKNKWQSVCMDAYLTLLFTDDHKVSRATIDSLPKFVRNADLTGFTSIFESGMPDEPLMNSGLIPAVLNLSSEYRFYNESPDYVIESNLEFVLHEICYAVSDGYEQRTVSFCHSLEVLLEAFPPTIYYEIWGCTNKLPSTSSGFLSTVLDMCELSLLTPSSLASGLNVLGKLFAGHCEGHMISTVREQASVDRSSLPRLPDPPLLERMLLLSLRTINMYYSMIAEHKSSTSVASNSILNRPTMSPRVMKKPSPSRIADISRLLGTNVHPSRATSFLESASIAQIFSHIQGSYSNYLEGIGAGKEKKFTFLLEAAMNCLACVCEMLTFAQLRPLLDEILLYIKVELEVCPESACRLLHQMFKVVFGKNAANINLNCLNSLKMKDPLPPSGDDEMYYLRYTNEFTVFSTLIKRREYVSNFINRELGWLKHDMLSKIHLPPQSDMASALELFEGFVTQLRHIYNSYQSVDFKKSVLGVMCELPRNGIIYSMADPKRIMLDLVISHTQDPAVGNMELLTEIILFLVVLARTSFLKFDDIIKVGSDLLEKVNEKNASHVLKSIRVLFLELLCVQQVDADILYTTFQTRTRDLMKYCPDETLLIWMVILHSVRDSEKRSCSVSIDFFGCFSEFSISTNSETECSFTIAAATLCSMSSSIFRPVDNFFQVLQFILEEDQIETKWSCIAIFIFVLLNCLEEEPLLLRLESLVDNPLQWLTQKFYGLVETGIKSLTQSDSKSAVSFMHFLHTVIAVFKTDRFTALRSSASVAIQSIVLPVDIWSHHGEVCSLWLQLLTLAGKEGDEAENILLAFEEDGHFRRMVSLFCTIKESTLSTNVAIVHPERCERNAIEGWSDLDETLVESVFADEKNCANSALFFPLVITDCQLIHRAFSVVPFTSRRQFLENFLTNLEEFLMTTTGHEETGKIIIAECQERLDVLKDMLYISDASSVGDVGDLLCALNIVDRICAVQPNLSWEGVNSSAVEFILRTVVQNWGIMESRLYGGLAFLLKLADVKSYLKELDQITLLADMISQVSRDLQKDCSVKYEKFSQLERFSVMGSSDKYFSCFVEHSGSAEAFMSELFDNCQHILQCMQRGKILCPKQRVFLRVIFRYPVIHSIAVAPVTALRMNWDLRIDLRPPPQTVHIPLVNIHMLGNIDVLKDFSWRINWLGWISRIEFEDYWMSLFGVLSSTPTGSEITSENSNVTEQILASSDAISVLTDILLYTLLFPEPGNVPSGSFVAKHREKNELFYQSKAFTQLRVLSAKLRPRVAPGCLFTKNLERLQNTDELYHLGQLCAISLWTLTGDLHSTKRGSPSGNKIRVSLSEYLLKTTCELDTASSVRALFENFSHWFSRGLEFLPLPLLSSTIKSMVLLSDLFDETRSYEFLYNQLKIVYRGGYLTDHADFGFVIYGLLKSATVIGVDVIERTMTEADVAKQLLGWVEAGLTSRYSFARCATLHGVHYILQSMSLDSLKPVFVYVSTFVLGEINDQMCGSDPFSVSSAISTPDYRNLVWSVAFRIMEEPMQANFKNSLNKVICDVFSTVNVAPQLFTVITAGVEGLILHSATYIPQFLEVVSHCFRDYSSMNHVFIFALRIFVACVFREELGPRSTTAGKFIIPLEELLSLYRRCDREGEHISRVLPAILLRLQGEEQTLTTILGLLDEQSLYCNRRSTLCMIYEFFQRLRESKRSLSVQEFARTARRRAMAMYKKSGAYNYVATCIILSAAEESSHLRFYLALNLLHDGDCHTICENLIASYKDLE